MGAPGRRSGFWLSGEAWDRKRWARWTRWVASRPNRWEGHTARERAQAVGQQEAVERKAPATVADRGAWRFAPELVGKASFVPPAPAAPPPAAPQPPSPPVVGCSRKSGPPKPAAFSPSPPQSAAGPLPAFPFPPPPPPPPRRRRKKNRDRKQRASRSQLHGMFHAQIVMIGCGQLSLLLCL